MVELTEEARQFYDDALKTATSGPQSTGYGHPINQELRFDRFLHLIMMESPGDYSLLDVGCGTGDLLATLQMLGREPREYLGIDLHEGMVQAARDRGLEQSPKARFVNCGVQDIQQEFDYSVAIGVFAHKDADKDMASALIGIQQQIEFMAYRTRKAVMVTLWSTWKNEVLPTELLVPPSTMFDWAMTKFGRVEIDHSYAPHDFTLVIHVDEGPWWKQYSNLRDHREDA